jgi:hypothetical protein
MKKERHVCARRRVGEPAVLEGEAYPFLPARPSLSRQALSRVRTLRCARRRRSRLKFCARARNGERPVSSERRETKAGGHFQHPVYPGKSSNDTPHRIITPITKNTSKNTSAVGIIPLKLLTCVTSLVVWPETIGRPLYATHAVHGRPVEYSPLGPVAETIADRSSSKSRSSALLISGGSAIVHCSLLCLFIL